MNFGDVISRITPSRTEARKIDKITKDILSSLCKYLEKHNVEVMLGGSMAKNTYLKTKDIDIFVRFPENSKDISKKLIDSLKSHYKIKVMHGSRDYVKMVYKKYIVEVIPVLNISPEKANNVMDVSPHHVEYVKKNLVNPNEVRLLKQFCKNNGLYGAESYLSGFSGYLLELLIIKYKTFANLVMNMATTEPGFFIDMSGYYKNKQEALRSIQKSALIVIDPVLKKRNVGACLSEEMLSKFVYLCRTFSDSPSKEFFFKRREMTEEKLVKRSKLRGTKMYFYKHKVKDEDKEKELSKLKKKVKKAKKKLEDNDFVVYSFGLLEKGTAYFGIVNPSLPPMKKSRGPPVWVKKEYFDSFVKKHKNVYVEGMYLVTDVKRKYTNAKKLLDPIFKK